MDALTSGKVVSLKSYEQMISTTQPSDPYLPFGYGLYTLQDQYGLQIGFLGAEASYVSYLVSYPENGLTIVLLSNTAKPANDLFEKIQANIPILIP